MTTKLIKTLERIGEEQLKLNSRIDERFSEIGERIELLESRKSSPGRLIQSDHPEVKAFEHYVRTGDKSALPEAKEMSIGGGAASGGAMVPELIAAQMIDRAIARSRLAAQVRQTTVGTSDYTRLVNLRGATAGWSGETDTRNATDTPQLREVKPTHGELYAYPSFTRWLAEDSQFNVRDFVQTNVADQFSKSIEDAVLFGNGSNKPTGIFNTNPTDDADEASPARDADAIQYIDGTDDLADDIIDLYFSLKPEYRARGTFVMSSATLAEVRKLRDSNGSGFLWQANLGADVDAPDGRLLGRPVVISEYMPVVAGSPAADSILFGDFNQGYELVRIGGMTLIRDDVTTPGRIKLYIAQRMGGRLTDNDALKVLKA